MIYPPLNVTTLPAMPVEVRIEAGNVWAVYVRGVREEGFSGPTCATDAWAYADRRKNELGPELLAEAQARAARKLLRLDPATGDVEMVLDGERIGWARTFQEGDRTLDALIDEIEAERGRLLAVLEG